MAFEKRIQNSVFVENQKEIENDWHKVFGDRKNEIVFIGQDIDEKQICLDLNKCLLTEKELSTHKWKVGYDDKWPVEKMI